MLSLILTSLLSTQLLASGYGYDEPYYQTNYKLVCKTDDNTVHFSVNFAENEDPTVGRYPLDGQDSYELEIKKKDSNESVFSNSGSLPNNAGYSFRMIDSVNLDENTSATFYATKFALDTRSDENLKLTLTIDEISKNSEGPYTGSFWYSIRVSDGVLMQAPGYFSVSCSYEHEEVVDEDYDDYD